MPFAASSRRFLSKNPTSRRLRLDPSTGARRPSVGNIALVTVYLIRHAHAIDQSSFSDDDAVRPLSDKGRTQARSIAGRRWFNLIEFRSSPAVRCMTTVAPLAARHGLEVIADESLAEGSDPTLAMAQIEAWGRGGLILCSHGDLIPELLHLLELRGAELAGEPRVAKASTWSIESKNGQPTTATLTGPPPNEP